MKVTRKKNFCIETVNFKMEVLKSYSSRILLCLIFFGI